MSDLEDIKFHWENHDLNMDAGLRPGKVILFSPLVFNDFEIGSEAENPIPVDEEEDKENSVPLPTTPISERPNQPTVLMRSRSFEQNWERSRLCLSTSVWKIWFYRFCVCIIRKKITNVFHFTITFFKSYRDICETKAFLVSLSLTLLVAASFRKYQAHTEKSCDAIAESKVKVLAKIKTRSKIWTVANAII